MCATEEMNLNLLNDDILNDRTDEDAHWEDLVTKVMEGNVIPVIGPDFQMNDEHDVDEFLIGWLAKYFKLTSAPKTYSQLIYTPQMQRFKDKIYNYIDQVLTKMPLAPSELIVKLLSTKKFPFVITTSFTPIVENVMRQVWGEVQVLQFRNDARRDRAPGVGDIGSERDLQKPTVFYMFGKHSYEAKRYAVTDTDFMVFCKSWLADQNVPKNLSTAIKKRTLLCLGSSYSDWLQRFIWFSMRTSVEDLRSSVIVSRRVEPTLEEFLQRLEASIQRDPQSAIDQLVRRIETREAQTAQGTATPRFENDVFLSYSRRDSDTAERLRAALQAQGLNVWFDDTVIQGADDWRERISHGIRTSRLFVPLLSRTIEREILEEHEYRIEWSIAAGISNRRGGQAFIFPINEKGFDFYNSKTKIPTEFQEKHAMAYDAHSDFLAAAQSIADRIAELRQLENKLPYGN